VILSFLADRHAYLH
jgi:hypothetical protein